MAPKSLRKPIPSYPVKAGLEGTSGIAEKMVTMLHAKKLF
jgi:hypothetical protein